MKLTLLPWNVDVSCTPAAAAVGLTLRPARGAAVGTTIDPATAKDAMAPAVPRAAATFVGLRAGVSRAVRGATGDGRECPLDKAEKLRHSDPASTEASGS